MLETNSLFLNVHVGTIELKQNDCSLRSQWKALTVEVLDGLSPSIEKLKVSSEKLFFLVKSQLEKIAEEEEKKYQGFVGLIRELFSRVTHASYGWLTTAERIRRYAAELSFDGEPSQLPTGKLSTEATQTGLETPSRSFSGSYQLSNLSSSDGSSSPDTFRSGSQKVDSSEDELSEDESDPFEYFDAQEDYNP